MDWTKVIGTGLLMAGAILGRKFNLPDEIVLAWGTLAPALWVVPPTINKVGSAVGKLVR